jgi:hypothetical protein
MIGKTGTFHSTVHKILLGGYETACLLTNHHNAITTFEIGQRVSSYAQY